MKKKANNKQIEQKYGLSKNKIFQAERLRFAFFVCVCVVCK